MVCIQCYRVAILCRSSSLYLLSRIRIEEFQTHKHTHICGQNQQTQWCERTWWSSLHYNAIKSKQTPWPSMSPSVTSWSNVKNELIPISMNINKLTSNMVIFCHGNFTENLLLHRMLRNKIANELFPLNFEWQVVHSVGWLVGWLVCWWMVAT